MTVCQPRVQQAQAQSDPNSPFLSPFDRTFQAQAPQAAAAPQSQNTVLQECREVKIARKFLRKSPNNFFVLFLQVAQETCYNIPQVIEKEIDVAMGFPQAKRDCMNQTVTIPEIKCEDIVETKCQNIPRIVEGPDPVERCEVVVGEPKCSEVELVLPKQICKDIVYGFAADDVAPQQQAAPQPQQPAEQPPQMQYQLPQIPQSYEYNGYHQPLHAYTRPNSYAAPTDTKSFNAYAQPTETKSFEAEPLPVVAEKKPVRHRYASSYQKRH